MPKARGLLLNELEQAVGQKAVREADLDVDRALDSRPKTLRGAFVSSRLLILVIGAALLTAGVIASMATRQWVWFGVALAVHALLSFVVIFTAFALTTQGEKPGPTTVTALEAEGVADPEGALNDLVEQVEADQRGAPSAGE